MLCIPETRTLQPAPARVLQAPQRKKTMIRNPVISLVSQQDYDSGLSTALEKLLAPLGGMPAFVKPGRKVLIKPNMLSDRTPEQAVTTHPHLVREVVRMVKDAGGNPAVGDSPASATKLHKVWQRTGIEQVCRDENIPLVSFERDGAVACVSAGFGFPVASAVLNADVVINLPKVKTHVFTTLTAGVKNLYGAIPGLAKTVLHRNYPDPAGFGRLVAAVYRRIAPALTIADGITAMDGEGPSGGRPYALGLLAAAEDAAALDMVLCRITGIKDTRVPYLSALREDGALPHGMAEIKFPVLTPDSFKAEDFSVPGTGWARLIPPSLAGIAKPLLWYRPVFDSKCIKCGRCIAGCPAAALVRDQETGTPALLRRKCIGCCCCHEICPVKAIRMDASPLIKLLRGR